MIELANILSFAGGVLVGIGIVFVFVAVFISILLYSKD
jgi:hypothetical protein